MNLFRSVECRIWGTQNIFLTFYILQLNKNSIEWLVQLEFQSFERGFCTHQKPQAFGTLRRNPEKKKRLCDNAYKTHKKLLNISIKTTQRQINYSSHTLSSITKLFDQRNFINSFWLKCFFFRFNFCYDVPHVLLFYNLQEMYMALQLLK